MSVLVRVFYACAAESDECERNARCPNARCLDDVTTYAIITYIFYARALLSFSLSLSLSDCLSVPLAVVVVVTCYTFT